MAQAKIENNIPRVNVAQAAALIVANYNAPGKHPICLWGEPGIGKTAITKKAAEMIEGDLIDFRLVTTEPVDLRGFPVTVTDPATGKVSMCWAPAELLPRSGRGILFLDEIAQAPTMNLNAASEIIYDRKMGNDYTLPDGWMVVAASNLRTHRAGTNELPTHIKNRFTHVEVTPSFNEWSAWAEQEGDIDPRLIEFLRSNERLFHDFKPDALAFPTARAWEFVSDYLKGGASKEILRMQVGGAVGKGVALELETYLDRGKGLPRLKDVLADPKGAPTGATESESYAILQQVMGEITPKDDLDTFIIYLNRHRRELVRIGVSKMINRDAAFLGHKNFKAFADGIAKRTA